MGHFAALYSYNTTDTSIILFFPQPKVCFQTGMYICLFVSPHVCLSVCLPSIGSRISKVMDGFQSVGR